MKMLTLFILLITFNSWAQNNLTAVAVNSPVQGKQVKIELDPPKDYVIKEVEYVLHDEKGKPISSPEKWNTVGLTSTSPRPAVTITVNQPPGDYKFHLRTIPKNGKAGKRNVMVPFTLVKVAEVPDPGEEGKLTLEGIDSDKNGIRDDVQIWINKNYPLDQKPNIHKALNQLAQSYQNVLVHSNEKELAISYKVKNLEGITCLTWITGEPGASRYYFKELESQILNTSVRIKASLKADSFCNGMTRPEHLKNTPIDQWDKFCGFEASKEE